MNWRRAVLAAAAGGLLAAMTLAGSDMPRQDFGGFLIGLGVTMLRVCGLMVGLAIGNALLRWAR